MDRLPMIKRLLRMDLAYRALAQEGQCISSDEERILSANPSFAAAVPEWGLGEGILIFAQAEEELYPILARQPRGYTATLYDFRTGASRTAPIGETLFSLGRTRK